MTGVFRLESPYRGEYVLHRLSFGQGGGPSIAVTAAVHGNEVNGVYAVNLVAGVLRVQRPRGIVHLLPCVNTFAADEGKKRWPFDDRDLNEAFPGDESGSPVERVAAAVLAATEADICIDVQTGSNVVHEAPHARTPISGPSLDLAAAAGLPVTWRRATDRFDEGLVGAWRAAGRTALVLRGGRAGQLDLDAARAMATAILRVVAHAGVVAPPDSGAPTVVTTEVREYRSGAGGFFVPEVRPGDRIVGGALLGLVRSPMGGDPLETLHASRSGVVLAVRTYPMVHARELVVRVAESG